MTDLREQVAAIARPSVFAKNQHGEYVTGGWSRDLALQAAGKIIALVRADAFEQALKAVEETCNSTNSAVEENGIYMALDAIRALATSKEPRP